MTRYDDYTVEIGPTNSTSTFTEPDAGDVRRVYYWVFRVPSQKRFIVRPFHDASAGDMADLTCKLKSGRIPSGWRGAEYKGKGHRRRRRADGTYEFYAAFGRILDDPLMQLELEMMIDLGSDVTA